MQNHKSKFKSNLNERCYRFGLEIISLADSLIKQGRSFVLADQLLRSSVSVGANLVEASSASSRREFKKFHEIALKSANETKYWLHLLKDSKKIEPSRAEILLKEISEIANMIAAGILTLKGRR